jgi:hypothetical protein
MTSIGRKSILGILNPDGEIDSTDRRAVLSIYDFIIIDKKRRSVLGIVVPDLEIDYFDRRAILGIYSYQSMGWVGKINNVTNFYKINGILVSLIGKVNGK